ncbi:hypothetical protein FNAPI_6164 [Fusarium napiforme]|uniref:DUF6594 domain-containing protein n=1 Tax=Fusarium napiforme TaxID=42672 RepID=A0A8H5N869_9HYPO|nr:hypothetical protein FNAPI_6164 [Fusarium napiforme]
MFRSFTRLHARVLLHKQDELAELEQRLDQLDQKDSKVDSYRLLTNRHSSGDTERRALLSEIEKKLNEFNNLLESLLAHLERPEPDESQIKSVRNWVDGKRPVVYSETTFLNDRSDLKRARHTVEKGGLENLLASYSSWPCLILITSRYICEIGRSESQAHQGLETGSCLTCLDNRTGCYHFSRADRGFILSAACPYAALYYCSFYVHILISALLAYVVQKLRNILGNSGILCRDGRIRGELAIDLSTLCKSTQQLTIK